MLCHCRGSHLQIVTNLHQIVINIDRLLAICVAVEFGHQFTKPYRLCKMFCVVLATKVAIKFRYIAFESVCRTNSTYKRKTLAPVSKSFVV